jgi:oxaloacetate decarboxylase alpha subunit
VRRAVELLSDGRRPDEAPVDLADLRARSGELAASEEDLLLLALFGEEAEPLLRTIRTRGRREETLTGGGVDQQRAERIREVVRIVQESGVAEITIEEGGTRVSVRRADERPAAGDALLPEDEAAAFEGPVLPAPERDGLVRVEAPMVGTFYRAAEPGAAPYVEEGDVVETGQTLCILEAMKLLNEIKAEVEGVVRKIHVRNAEPVEFGQLLFELEPIQAPPLDAL